MIEDFFEIAEDGNLYSPSWHDANQGENFKIIPIVGVQWKYKGKIIQKKYPYNNGPQLLPQKDGVIATEKSLGSSGLKNELVVYEPDGKERFRITPPQVSKNSIPEKAFFFYAKYIPSSGIWVCLFDDGAGEYTSRLNIKSGQLTGIKKTRV